MCKFCIFIYPICALVKMSAICNNICYDFYADFSEVGYMKNKNSISRYFYRQNSAFSLVELLMALLVASLLLAALAPVMTRKFNDNINLSGLGDPIKAPADIKCFPYTDTNPEITLPINDVYYANFIIASGGGGGAGATNPKIIDGTPYMAQSTSTSNASPSALTITEDIDNIKIDFMTAGGGGGGGGAVKYVTKFTPSVSACQSFGKGKMDTVGNTGINFATYDGVNKICVTKFNQKSADWGCWYNYEHGYSGSVNSAYTYSGRQRWVCNHNAAEAACSEIKTSSGYPWRLPTKTELQNWNSVTMWRALALCETNTDTSGAGGITVCNPGNSASVVDGYAQSPYQLWSGTSSGSNSYYRSYLSFGTYDLGGHKYTAPFSVRCILPETYTFYSISGGGGGASPSVASSNSINNELNTIVKNNVGGSIEIVAGGGGNGGTKASSANIKAGNGTNGKDSIIRIKNKEGTVVFKITVTGGKYGNGADGSIGTEGTAGIAQSATLMSQGCYKQYSETGSKTYFNCTNEGKAGTSGVVTGVTVANTQAAGGYGGISSFTGASSTGAYYTADIRGATLSDGSNPGAGGGAGRSIASVDIPQSTEYNTKHSIGAGGRGSGGYVKLLYKRKFPGAGGGGGGGGSVAHIKNLYIGKTAECTLTIGKGGKGGNIDNNGMDGTLSSIKCNTDSRTFIVHGGKGGKKGTPAQNQTSNPTPGIKGEHGEINQYILSLEPDKKEIKKGLDGKDASYNKITKESIGGRGGTSGTGTKGACGGLYEEENICEVSNTDIKRIEGKGFTYEDIITPTSKDIQNNIYGTSSAGGGGGGWTRALPPGKGGDGMPGYICVYWHGE